MLRGAIIGLLLIQATIISTSAQVSDNDLYHGKNICEKQKNIDPVFHRGSRKHFTSDMEESCTTIEQEVQDRESSKYKSDIEKHLQHKQQSTNIITQGNDDLNSVNSLFKKLKK